MNVKEIRREFEQLVSQRNTIEGTWDLIEKFIAPIRGGRFFDPQSTEHSINHRRPEIYDNTAINASVNLAATLQGYLTSDVVPWFMFRFRDKTLNFNTEARQWLEEAAKVTYNHLQDSNFSAEMGEAYLDIVTFGNTALTVEFEDGELVYQCVPVREIYYIPDHRSRVLRFYRLLQWSAAQILNKFPDTAPDCVRKCADLDRKFDVVFCIYPNKDKQGKGVTTPEKRPWKYCYVMRTESSPDEAELGSGGLYENPAMVTRWSKSSGSRWGHGPGNIALPAVMTLNELTKMVLAAAEKVIDPASLVTQRGLLSDLDLSAGGQTVVRDPDAVRPYESGARFDVSAMQIADLRSAIERVFLSEHTDVAMSDRMSATEYQGRHQRMARMLGGTLGRLSREFFDPTIEKSFNHLVREGLIPPYPASIARTMPDIDIVYTGPLSMAQKVDQLQGAMGYIGFAAQMAEILPGMLDPLNPEKFTKWAFEASGLPFAVMRTEREVKEIQMQRQEQQAQMQQAQQAQMEGEAMKSVGEGQQAMMGEQ
jgi:hypothetical protein